MSEYRGRFAPSPTGDLHQGSLVAALASYLDARHHEGIWQLRFDDIDPPRQVAGSVESISKTLEMHGLAWDGPVQFQSNHSARYLNALDRLKEQNATFTCICTRATLGSDGACEANCDQHRYDQGSVRLKSSSGTLPQYWDLCTAQDVFPNNYPANFVLRRKDGLFSYQLATAVDDALDEFTHVVRGGDLKPSTHRQLYIQTLLGLHKPQYGHIGIVTDGNGVKLSKQTGATPINCADPAKNIRSALSLLKQTPPPKTAKNVAAILTWAIERWDRSAAAL